MNQDFFYALQSEPWWQSAHEAAPPALEYFPPIHDEVGTTFKTMGMVPESHGVHVPPA